MEAWEELFAALDAGDNKRVIEIATRYAHSGRTLASESSSVLTAVKSGDLLPRDLAQLADQFWKKKRAEQGTGSGLAANAVEQRPARDLAELSERYWGKQPTVRATDRSGMPIVSEVPR